MRSRASPAASPTTSNCPCCACGSRSPCSRRSAAQASWRTACCGSSCGREQRTPPGSHRQRAPAGVRAGGAGHRASGSPRGTLADSSIGWVVGPLGVAAVGAAVVWREADESQRRRWDASRRAAAWPRVRWWRGERVAAGAGRRGVRRRRHRGVPARQPGSWARCSSRCSRWSPRWSASRCSPCRGGCGWCATWARSAAQRIVEAERAEIAAHLHDSVLQTLALIQRQSDQPREVLRLARGQERELRGWLYGPAGYGRASPRVRSEKPAPGLAAAITTAAARGRGHLRASTSGHVVVGDRPLDDELRALVLAAREAMVNAAKHAEVGRDQRVRRGRDRPRCTCSSATAASASTPTACPPTGTASPTRSRAGWTGTAARFGCAARPGEGTEVHLRDAASAGHRGSP